MWLGGLSVMWPTWMDLTRSTLSYRNISHCCGFYGLSLGAMHTHKTILLQLYCDWRDDRNHINNRGITHTITITKYIAMPVTLHGEHTESSFVVWCIWRNCHQVHNKSVVVNFTWSCADPTTISWWLFLVVSIWVLMQHFVSHYISVSSTMSRDRKWNKNSLHWEKKAENILEYQVQGLKHFTRNDCNVDNFKNTIWAMTLLQIPKDWTQIYKWNTNEIHHL